MVERYRIPVSGGSGYKHFYTYILAIYFLLAPFEDVLTFSSGTLGKWLAVLAVMSGIYETRGRIKLRFKDGNLCLVYLMVLGLVSCLWAIAPDIAFSRNAAYFTLPGFCLFVSALDFSQKEYENIVRAAVFGGIAVSVYLLLNGHVADSGRVHLDESNDPNNLAALLQLPLAISFRLTARKYSRGRIFYGICTLLILFTLLMTGSRGGMVSAIVFFLAYFLLSKAYKKAGVLLGILLAAFLFWKFILPSLPSEITSRLFETDYSRELISGSRIRIWRVVFYGLIPKMPAYGVGAGCAPYALTQWFTRGKAVHNTYLCMICEYGALGIWAFVWFLFEKLKKQMKRHNYAEAALIICICVTIFFLDSYAKKFFWNVVILATIAGNVPKKERAGESLEEEI